MIVASVFGIQLVKVSVPRRQGMDAMAMLSFMQRVFPFKRSEVGVLDLRLKRQAQALSGLVSGVGKWMFSRGDVVRLGVGW